MQRMNSSPHPAHLRQSSASPKMVDPPPPGEGKKNPRRLLHVLPPVVGFLEAQHLARFAVRERRLEFIEFAPDRNTGAMAGEKRAGRLIGGDGVVDGVEHLEA